MSSFLVSGNTLLSSYHSLINSYNIAVEMNKVKMSLDSKSRRQRCLQSQKTRKQFERSLPPSCATLIIVPLALLEHWCEQILRHLSLRHLADNDSGGSADDAQESLRGLVYLDGLGDIVDVQTPLSSLQMRGDQFLDCADQVSGYLIVITTLERCAAEGRKLSGDTTILSTTTIEAGDYGDYMHKSGLLQRRWLRLIVDEGHELTLVKKAKRTNNGTTTTTSTGDSVSDISASFGHQKLLVQATSFLHMIAAERRWIMSGTPTTGARAEEELSTLFTSLSFLRHPAILEGRIGSKANKSNTVNNNYYNNQNNSVADMGSLWRREVIEKCVKQDAASWGEVTALLQPILVRHTKVML
jgi:SNF2 family DNA or RNA helicase